MQPLLPHKSQFIKLYNRLSLNIFRKVSEFKIFFVPSAHKYSVNVASKLDAMTLQKRRRKSQT